MIEELRLELREAELTARVRVVRDEHAQLFIRDEREVGVEPLRVAAVPDDSQTVTRLLVESEREAGKPRIVAERARVHALGGRVGENALAIELAVVQVRDHELRHVGRAGGNRPRRHRFDDLELLRLVRAAAPRVAVGHVGPQALRHRLARRRLRHAERREHMLLDVVVPRHAGHALHDVAGERRGVVGVRRVRARRSHASRNVRGEPAAERDECGRIVADEIP